jgi:hypothetical protein
LVTLISLLSYGAVRERERDRGERDRERDERDRETERAKVSVEGSKKR